jgi:regulator of cell morphogenesis and NO signaling
VFGFPIVILEMRMKESITEQTSDRTVGEFVAENYRAAKVFEKYGIDFCCGGNVALAAICENKWINLAAITKELEAVKSEPIERSQNYASWEMPFLADFIINAHHSYIKGNISQIAVYTHKIAAVHGANHPEVIKIAAIFDKIAADMVVHLGEEEEVFFPAIKRADAARKAGAAPVAKDIEMIKKSLAKLGHEHEEIGDAMHAIRHLAKEYAIPGDVCNTFVVTYQKLKEFEDDLHKHVHLENNILFIKAAQL